MSTPRIFSITTTVYIHILQAFKGHLTTQGYVSGSIQGYTTAIAEFLVRLETHFEVMKLSDIRPHHIQRHLHYLETRRKFTTEGGLSASMLRNHLYALRLLFIWLVKMEYIDANPLSGGIELPVAGSPYRIAITEEEVQKLFSACIRPLESALLCLAYSGLRRKEIWALNCTDILWDEHYIIVRESKFHKRREVPAPPKVMSILSAYYQTEREELLNRDSEDARKAFLLATHGDRVSSGLVYDIFKKILSRTDLPKEICPHVLRHSFGTHLKMRGCPAEVIQQLLGHKDLDTTMHYLRYQEMHLAQSTKHHYDA